MTFYKNLRETQVKTSLEYTENGALGYKTTGKELLDMNFKVSSYRNLDDQEIKSDFTRVYFENPELAIKFLFFVRDVREGMGERRLFRVCFLTLIDINGDLAHKLIDYISEYGRWDDLVYIHLNTKCVPIKEIILSIIYCQLEIDFDNYNHNKSVSLLAKWFPSEKSKTYPRFFIEYCSFYGIAKPYLRKILRALREYLKVVETKMCKKEWHKIDYSGVPSKANLIYNGAFLRNDTDRRSKYLDDLKSGKTKINAGTIFPHEIVNKYIYTHKYDETLEQLWKALPKNEIQDTIVVADGSGSMSLLIGNTTVSASDVATALAIYFSEKMNSQFKNNFITFSRKPQLVNLDNCKSLREKINKTISYREASNTDIEATFDLILQTAIRNEYKQSDIPKNILIISDMEFDNATYNSNHKTLFEIINKKYLDNGYKMPKLIFWNVNSRTNVIPMQENENGVVLVSGFSTNVANMIMSGKTDPYEILVEKLNSERYSKISLT